MNFELSQPKGFISIFKSLEQIIDEIHIECNHDGIIIKALDDSHVTFVSLDLKPDYFDTYTYKTEPEHLNIDIKELTKILTQIEKDDILKISNDEENLIIVFDGESKRTYNLKLIDMEYTSPKPPETEHPVFIELPLELLKKQTNNVHKSSPTVRLEVNPDYFIMGYKSEFNTMELEYLHGEKVDGEYRSCFTTEIVSNCLKADKFTDIVKIGLGDDMPLKIVIGNDYGALSFLIAPRIEPMD